MTPPPVSQEGEKPWVPHPEQALFVSKDAEHYRKLAGQPYQPSNGTEGEIFQGRWCAHCRLDEAFRADPDKADGCAIIADTMALRSDDPDYPKAWVWGADGQPQCTAFSPCARLREALVTGARQP